MWRLHSRQQVRVDTLYIPCNTPTIRGFIDYLRHASPGHLYATSMSIPAVEQVISALKLIQGHDGSDRGPSKMQQLRDNSNYFRRKLKQMTHGAGG